MDCNPCQFCRNLYDDSDTSVGYYGYGCKAADDGFETFDEVKPCPCFKPIPAHWGLLEQLYNEQEERWYREEQEMYKELDEE